MTQTAVMTGCDFDASNMNYPVLRASGFRFAMRYVVPSIPGKMITRQEITNAHAAGVDVGFIYETTGTTWQGGYIAGVDDANAARTALASIGAPSGITVFHAVDSQVPDSELPTVLDWLNGLEHAHPPWYPGIYGQYSVMTAVAGHAPHIPLWQTTAWSAGRVFPALDLYQFGTSGVNGIQVDRDIAFTDDFGQWSASPPPLSQEKDYQMVILRYTDTAGKVATFTYNGTTVRRIVSEQDQAKVPASIPVWDVSEAQLAELMGES